MDTRIPSSTRRSAPPAQGVEGRRLPSYGHGQQPQRGEGSASRLPTQIPATATTRDARPPGMVAPLRVGTPNRDERPVSTATTSSHSRYSASSYQSITPNSNWSTAVAGASHYRPTSTASQPEYGDSGYQGWARRNDRLAALRSPARGHEYAAAGIVRSYHRVPSSLRSEDAYSTQSPLPSLTESDNASASIRWGDPTGALRHATQAVAPSVHSHAGRLTVATTTTHREDSVARIRHPLFRLALLSANSGRARTWTCTPSTSMRLLTARRPNRSTGAATSLPIALATRSHKFVSAAQLYQWDSLGLKTPSLSIEYSRVLLWMRPVGSMRRATSRLKRREVPRR
jgi:hypothetical protein